MRGHQGAGAPGGLRGVPRVPGGTGGTQPHRVAPQAIVWDEYLTGPFGLIAQYSLLKVRPGGAAGGGGSREGLG